MIEEAKQAPGVWVALDKPGGEIAYLIGQWQRMNDLDRRLFLDIADQLPALGRYMMASWLWRTVMGEDPPARRRIMPPLDEE